MENPADETTIELTGLRLPINDLETNELAGSYTAAQLADLFIDTWIPFLECQKCGRHDYCKYAKPSPYGWAHRRAEIQCGVAADAIRNYVTGVFGILVGRPAMELQGWLDASYQLAQFIYSTELHIGGMIDKDHLKWWGTDEYRAGFFGWPVQLRKRLDRFAASLAAIPEFRTTSCVILTEGASEKGFLERLKRTRLLWFLYLEIDSYYGTGNRHPTKLLALSKRMRDQGYRLFIQGDVDGRATDIFEQLVKQGIVERGDTFSFNIDFESSFTADQLHAALELMGLDSVDKQAFEGAIATRPPDTSVVGVIEGLIDTELDKVELAEALADVLEDTWAWNDDAFWSTEIGQFLAKIRQLPT